MTGAVMAALIVTGVAIVAAWCFCAFLVAGAVGRAFAHAAETEAAVVVPLPRTERMAPPSTENLLGC